MPYEEWDTPNEQRIKVGSMSESAAEEDWDDEEGSTSVAEQEWSAEEGSTSAAEEGWSAEEGSTSAAEEGWDDAEEGSTSATDDGWDDAEQGSMSSEEVIESGESQEEPTQAATSLPGALLSLTNKLTVCLFLVVVIPRYLYLSPASILYLLWPTRPMSEARSAWSVYGGVREVVL